MRSTRRWAVVFLAAASAPFGCGGDGPSEPSNGPPDLTRSGSTSGTFVFDEITIPAGVTITATGPLDLRTDGDVMLEGTIVGDCVPITINGGATFTVTGDIDNSCGELPEEGAPPALVLVADGDMLFEDGDIVTSGDLEIKNDPTLMEADFGDPGEALLSSGTMGAMAASATPARADGGSLERANASAGGGPTVVIRNRRFIARPEAARDGTPGQDGTNGRDGANWRLLVRGDLIMGGGNLIQGQAGGNGGTGTHTGTPASATGGDGGAGGRISVMATGQVAIGGGSSNALAANAGGGSNRIASGGGGGGGGATANSMAGTFERAAGATALGGDGGGPGLIRVRGEQGLSVDQSVSLQIGDSGDGGNGTATAADGQAICINGHGQHGGHAEGRGGEGGSTPDRRLFEGGNITLSGDPTVTGASGGAGGKGTATAGNGAPGQNCTDCKNGGDGGDFQAHGGDGGDSHIEDLDGEKVGNGGNGGASEHHGGNGGRGAECCIQPNLAEGGDGGKGGSALGGDGMPGTGKTEGAKGGVMIGSGNGGDAGSGLPGPGDPGDGGTDATTAIGMKMLVGGPHFMPGDSADACPPPPPSGTAIQGIYALSGSRVQETGNCNFAPGITNTGIEVEYDGSNVIVNSSTVVTGPYNGTTGDWTGTGTAVVGTLGQTLRETYSGTWMQQVAAAPALAAMFGASATGEVTFEGTLKFEFIETDDSVVCSATYLAFLFKIQ